MTYKIILHDIEEPHELIDLAVRFATGFVGAYIDAGNLLEDRHVHKVELFFKTEQDVVLYNLRNI